MTKTATAEPEEPFDPEAFKRWSPAAQAKALAALQDIKGEGYRPFYCPKGARGYCDGKPHDDWAWKHARSDQHPPKGDDWLVWLLRGGRGSGKTRTGSEFTHRATKVAPRIALIAPTGSDVRDTMVEGESGILATAPPGMRPHWEPSKRRLTWPNGARGTTFSGEEPDRLRGPQHHVAWLDEPAHMPLIEDVWSNLLFGLRLGRRPRICATTTPLPTKWMKELVADPKTVSVVAPTIANLHNLAPTFADEIMRKFDGTRKGRQELYGEILDDVEGALWHSGLIEAGRIRPEDLPELDRIVVGIDPAGTARKKSDETGIVVVGVLGDHIYILEDGSGRMSPTTWAKRALSLYEKWSADALVVEQQYGGDMVITTLQSALPGEQLPRIIKASTRRGKALRAEPVVSMYEQTRAHHVGLHAELEDQMCSWIPTQGQSPDRVDAMVHAATAVANVSAPTQIASPLRLIPGGQSTLRPTGTDPLAIGHRA